MRTLLFVLAVGQGAFLVTTFVFLIFRRWRDSIRVVQRELERLQLGRAIREVVDGRRPHGDLAGEIDRCGRDNVTVVLQQYATTVSAACWGSVSQAVRQSHWYLTVTTRFVTSRFWWRRLMGARALALVGTDKDVGTARQLIGDSHAAVQLAAISIASRLHDPDLLDAVLGQAVGARRVVRQYMFDKLVAVGSPLVPVLQRRLSAPRSVFELCDLVRLAGTLAAPELQNHVLSLAEHEDKSVRGAVARALGHYGDKCARTVLEGLLSDEVWEVRTRAATALGMIGDGRSSGALSQAIYDSNWWVRLRAAVALRRLGAQGVQDLDSVAASDDRYASEMATYVLRLTDAAVQDYSA
ncbi:MAG: HEAT repeat domain-containing protein [Gemmatimonadales bacterium]